MAFKPDEDTFIFCKALTDFIEKHEIGLKYIAFHCGCSYSYIQLLKRGKVAPNPIVVEGLAKLIPMTTEEKRTWAILAARACGWKV